MLHTHMFLFSALSAFVWLGSVMFTWFILSLGMFIFSMGHMSWIKGSRFHSSYWKWSILGAFYLNVPILGWGLGVWHLTHCVKKSFHQKNSLKATI